MLNVIISKIKTKIVKIALENPDQVATMQAEMDEFD